MNSQKLIFIVLYLFSFSSKGQDVKLDGNNIRFYRTDSIGISRMYYENGQLEKEGKLIRKKFGLLPRNARVYDGLWKYYFENGNLKARGTFTKGNKEGLWEFYNIEGKLLQVVLYSKNKVLDKRVYIDEKPFWEDAEFKNKNGVYIAN